MCLGLIMGKSFSMLLVVVSASLTVAVVGCGETVDEVTNSITCGEVCARYADCFDADYDVDGCTDRCENDATANEDHERRLEICDDCLDGLSCTEATFSCTDDCVGIVP
jgi:hypothetical protein